MIRRIMTLSAAAAAALVLTLTAAAANGGVVGNIVDAGEDIVNDVVDAGENVVDDVTDAVTGDNNATGGTTGDNTTSAPDEAPDITEETADVIIDNGTANPDTGITFAYGAAAALALGAAGVALTLRRDD